MLPKRQSIGRSSSRVREKKLLRTSGIDEWEERLKADRIETTQARSFQKKEMRESRLAISIENVMSDPDENCTLTGILLRSITKLIMIIVFIKV